MKKNNTVRKIGYSVPSGLKDYFRNMYKYDDVVGGYESDLIANDLLNNDCIASSMFNITSSVPLDFVIKPKKREHYKLFYVGINLEKIQNAKMWYSELIKDLNKKDLRLICKFFFAYLNVEIGNILNVC